MLENFFRGDPSDFSLDIFGRVHLLFLFIALIGVFYLVENREELKGKKKFKNLIIYTLLTQQALLYIWYSRSGYFSIEESLPLYNCRLAIIALVLGEFFGRERLKSIGMYWGLMGAILALLVPVLDPFGYDHFTFYSFFIGHIFLLWGSLYLILVEEKEVDDRSLKEIWIFTNIYHTVVFLFDKSFGANYCYLIESPVMEELLGQAPQLVYTLLVILFFDFVIYLTHLGIKNIIKKTRVSFYDDMDEGIIY